MLRVAMVLGALIGLALPALAKPIPLRGSLDAQALQGSVELIRVEGEALLEAKLGDYRGRGRRIGAGLWKVTLTRGQAVGLAGRLQGREGDLRALTLLLTNTGEAIHAALYREGERVGRLGARRSGVRDRQTRRGRRPVREPDDFNAQLGEPSRPRQRRLVRNLPLLRQGVATWGTLRALWDFYKPGSRDFEELRGDYEARDTQRVLARLSQLPGPLTPAVIFRVARAETQSDLGALQLSFATVLDHAHSLELEQLPGIAAEEPVFDKFKHFFGCAVMAYRSNGAGSFFVGWLKEVMDGATGSGYSEPDLIADALGADFAERLLRGQE